MAFEYSPKDAADTLGLKHALEIRAESNDPLFLMIHGRAGNAKVVSAFLSCLPQNVNVIAPEAKISDLHGYSWWLKNEAPDYQEIDQAADTLLSFLEASLNYYKLNPRKIFLLGFSQGAALSSVLIQKRPEMFAGLVMLAGLTVELPEYPTNSSTFSGKDIFIAHGSEDEIIPLEFAKISRKFFEEAGAKVFFHQDPVGHKIGAAGMRHLKNWIPSLDLT